MCVCVLFSSDSLLQELVRLDIMTRRGPTTAGLSLNLSLYPEKMKKKCLAFGLEPAIICDWLGFKLANLIGQQCQGYMFQSAHVMIPIGVLRFWNFTSDDQVLRSRCAYPATKIALEHGKFCNEIWFLHVPDLQVCHGMSNHTSSIYET